MTKNETKMTAGQQKTLLEALEIIKDLTDALETIHIRLYGLEGVADMFNTVNFFIEREKIDPEAGVVLLSRSCFFTILWDSIDVGLNAGYVRGYRAAKRELRAASRAGDKKTEVSPNCPQNGIKCTPTPPGVLHGKSL